jgi:hypothetical protein
MEVSKEQKDAMQELANSGEEFEKSIREMVSQQEVFWATLTPEQQLDVFCCVVRRIVDGELVQKGSYRYVLYDVFKWGPEAYLPAQIAGYMALHNAIVTDGDIEQ